jgi:hypothetical protein
MFGSENLILDGRRWCPLAVLISCIRCGSRSAVITLPGLNEIYVVKRAGKSCSVDLDTKSITAKHGLRS